MSSSSKNPPGDQPDQAGAGPAGGGEGRREVQTNPAVAGQSGGGDELRREGQGTGGADQSVFLAD